MLLPLFFVVPSAPRLVEVSINSSSVMLRWRPPEMVNGVITHYSLHLNGTNIVNINISSSMRMYTTGDLSPDTEYVLELRAHTGAGPGPPNGSTIMTSKLLLVLCTVY